MSGTLDDFEKRFSNAWFSSGWSEIEVKTQPEAAVAPARKDLDTLKRELDEINLSIESITQKQLRLQNLAKFYN